MDTQIQNSFALQLAANIIKEYEAIKMKTRLLEAELLILGQARKNAYMLCQEYSLNPPCEKCRCGCIVDLIKIMIDKKCETILEICKDIIK